MRTENGSIEKAPDGTYIVLHRGGAKTPSPDLLTAYKRLEGMEDSYLRAMSFVDRIQRRMNKK